MLPRIFFKMTMQQKLSNVKWAHMPVTIYPMMTNYLDIWEKNYLDQIQTLHVALRSHHLKVQMPEWKHSLNHLIMLLFYTNILMPWDKLHNSRKS